MECQGHRNADRALGTARPSAFAGDPEENESSSVTL